MTDLTETTDRSLPASRERAGPQSADPARPQAERVGFSPGRVGVIALNTFVESVRQKVFNILLIFALVAIASASFFSQFTFSEQLKFVKDWCLGAMAVCGTLIAIVGTAQLLPAEIENRTIYTILAKPVRRVEFLLGKFGGSVLLIFLSLVMMAVLFGAALVFKENRLIAERRTDAGLAADQAAADIQAIHDQARDPDVVKGILLIFTKLALLAAVTLLISTVSHSMVFNVAVALLVFFAGHLRSTAVDLWASQAWVRWLLAVIPDLGAFNVTDDIVLGNAIPWSHVGGVCLYGVGYTLAVLAAAQLVFLEREI